MKNSEVFKVVAIFAVGYFLLKSSTSSIYAIKGIYGKYNFIAISWKEAKAMVDDGDLKIIGGNYSQINNQGDYTISSDYTHLYKRRHSASKPIYDLIAKS